MILYKSSKGQWVGTQRDAQRYFPRDWEQVDVPVSKVYLIEFLNENIFQIFRFFLYFFFHLLSSLV